MVFLQTISRSLKKMIENKQAYKLQNRGLSDSYNNLED